MNHDSFLNSKMNQEWTIRENSRIVPTLNAGWHNSRLFESMLDSKLPFLGE